MPRLLSGRVYRLNGVRLVARQSPQNNVFDLFTDNNMLWSQRQAGYRAEADGSITYQGAATAWNTADLLDTGVDLKRYMAGV